MKKSILYELRQVLFPDDIKCIVCGREIRPDRYGLCDKCKLDLNVNYCVRCGRHKVGVGDYCDECSEQTLYFDEARSAVNYDGNAKNLIRRLKYGNARYLARPLSEYMLDILLTSDWQFECITFVPIHAKREKKRGYNQARLLAEEIAASCDKPCLSLLGKIKNTPNQASLDRSERESNLIGAFSVKEKPPEHVVLVDDVMTTGATVNECCKVLKKAGAKFIYVLTFASVPEKPALDTRVQNIKDFRK